MPTDLVEVPDLMNRNRYDVRYLISLTSLYVQSKGSTSANATVTGQSYAPGTMVPRGTTITVEYTDHSAQD